MSVKGFKVVTSDLRAVIGKGDDVFTVGSLHVLGGKPVMCYHGFHFSASPLECLLHLGDKATSIPLRLLAVEADADHTIQSACSSKYATTALRVTDEVVDTATALTGVVTSGGIRASFRNGYLHQDDDGRPAYVSPTMQRWCQNGRPGRCDGSTHLPTTIRKTHGRVVYMWEDEESAQLHRPDDQPAQVVFCDGRAERLEWRRNDKAYERDGGTLPCSVWHATTKIWLSDYRDHPLSVLSVCLSSRFCGVHWTDGTSSEFRRTRTGYKVAASGSDRDDAFVTLASATNAYDFAVWDAKMADTKPDPTLPFARNVSIPFE
jgi:hypothetical protein